MDWCWSELARRTWRRPDVADLAPNLGHVPPQQRLQHVG